MKAFKRLAVSIGACLLAEAAFGQAQVTPYVPSPSTPQRDRTSESTRSKQFFRSKDLVGASVKDSQGKKVGDISELYLNPQTGAVMALVHVSGARDAVVPLEALTVTPATSAFRNAQVTLKTTKAELESGPMLTKNEMNKLDSATFNQQVYTHYNLQPPASAMGGSEPAGGTSTGSGSSGGSTRPPELIPHEDRPPR